MPRNADPDLLDRVLAREESRVKLLLVASRDLSGPSGEWRLISNRSAALRSGFGILTDLLYLRPQHAETQSLCGIGWRNEILNSPRFDHWSDPRLYFAIAGLKKQIRQWLLDNPRGYVVLSGFQLYIAPLGIPKQRLIIDLHGTLKEWIEGVDNTRRGRILRFGFPVASFAERRSLAGTWGAFSVASELSDYARKSGVQNVWTIPCGVFGSSFPTEFHRARNEWRVRLSIPSHETVFVYSGGIAKWQCLEEAVQLFGQVREKWPGPCRLVILTPRITEAAAFVAQLPPSTTTLRSVSPDEIAGALCACDIGLLLRDDTATNHNAFPNKFAEYLSAGLFVVSSPGLKDPSRFLLRHRLGMLIDPPEIRLGLGSDGISLLVSAYCERGSQEEYVQRAAAATEELAMERLVAPFARDITKRANEFCDTSVAIASRKT